MGFSDLGCYGGEVQTPNLDSLAANGLRYTQFYNTAKCCPSRASLLTGLHPHQADVGHMAWVDDGLDGYRGDLNPNTVTIAEALGNGGYATYMSGKWHVTRFVDGPKHNWPCQRGFDDYYGILTGAANYYHPRTLTRNNERIEPEGDDYFLTDVISDEAARQILEHAKSHDRKPFFQYVAYTAPHWPLHAHEEDIAKYKGRFDAGWDELRKQRLRRLVDMGIIDERWLLSERNPKVEPWSNVEHKEWQARRMEVYAAQIDRIDQGVGRILSALRETDQWQNTLIVFLSDNGGAAEGLRDDFTGVRIRNGRVDVGTAKTHDDRDVRFGDTPDIMPGGEDTYSSYGPPWANLSNTPFRLFKSWVHEGGIATPFIAHWPIGIVARGELRHQPAQLPDLLPTFLELAGVDYPAFNNGHDVKPLEGFSLTPTFMDRPHNREALYWEHEGNRAVRKSKWKLVSEFPGDWELYDMERGRTELDDVVNGNPEIVRELEGLYNEWSERCNVAPWSEILETRKQRRLRARQQRAKQ